MVGSDSQPTGAIPSRPSTLLTGPSKASMWLQAAPTTTIESTVGRKMSARIAPESRGGDARARTRAGTRRRSARWSRPRRRSSCSTRPCGRRVVESARKLSNPTHRASLTGDEAVPRVQAQPRAKPTGKAMNAPNSSSGGRDEGPARGAVGPPPADARRPRRQGQRGRMASTTVRHRHRVATCTWAHRGSPCGSPPGRP